MAVWPLVSAGVAVEGGALTASSLMTTVTAGTAHAKGVWVTMVAATPFDSKDLYVVSSGASFVTATDTSALFEVAIGAAGGEQVIVPEVACGHLNPNDYSSWRFPVAVPAGARVSIRMQSAVVSKTATFQVRLAGGGVVGPEASAGTGDAYGVLTVSSGGTLLTLATAQNTKSAWTQLVAAAPERGRFLVPSVQPIAGVTNLLVTGLVDVGVGAIGSEQVICANIPYSHTASENLSYAAVTVPVTIPSGARIVARYQGTIITAASSPRVSVVVFP